MMGTSWGISARDCSSCWGVGLLYSYLIGSQSLLGTILMIGICAGSSNFDSRFCAGLLVYHGFDIWHYYLLFAKPILKQAFRVCPMCIHLALL